MSGTGQILLQEGRAEMEKLVVKAGQLRDEGITDIEEYRKEGISDVIYNVVLGIKPNN